MPSRRLFLRASAALLTTAGLAGMKLSAQAPAVTPSPRGPKPEPLPPEKVRSTVGQAHRSLDEVRKLVEETPLLANACWDWGGGDFETALEAAAHTGGIEIARYLLSKGARPSLYAAGMLGQLDLVKAFLAADPKAHEIPGPHGYTLLHCVQQGGEPARPVLEWLLAQGVPDVTFRPLNFVWPAPPAATS